MIIGFSGTELAVVYSSVPRYFSGCSSDYELLCAGFHYWIYWMYLLQWWNSIQEVSFFTDFCFSPPQSNVPWRKMGNFFLTKECWGEDLEVYACKYVKKSKPLSKIWEEKRCYFTVSFIWICNASLMYEITDAAVYMSHMWEGHLNTHLNISLTYGYCLKHVFTATRVRDELNLGTMWVGRAIKVETCCT